MTKKASRVILILAIALATYLFHETRFLQRTLEWIQSYGSWGPLVFLGVYITSCVFFIPSFVFTFSGGILFGLWQGAALSLIGIGIGSILAFWIGRYLAHDYVVRKFSHNNQFLKLSTAIRKKGWKIITLARMTPVIPFLVGNYAFGTTKMRSRHYFGSTILGTVPSALVYAYMGSVTGDLANLDSMHGARTPEQWALIVIGLIAAIGLALYLKRFARHALAEA